MMNEYSVIGLVLLAIYSVIGLVYTHTKYGKHKYDRIRNIGPANQLTHVFVRNIGLALKQILVSILEFGGAIADIVLLIIKALAYIVLWPAMVWYANKKLVPFLTKMATRENEN